MRKPVRLRVRSHGAYQVEFKTDYELSSSRETRYIVNTYIFIPYNLGVSSRTYSNSDFHRDIQNYVRLSTPVFYLDSLLIDPASPLVKCEQLVTIRKWHKSRHNRTRFITNLKMMRPVLNASLRAHLRSTLEHRRCSRKSKESTAELQGSLELLVNRAREYVDRLRALEGQVADLDGVDQITLAFRYADEATSLVYEDALVWAFRITDKYLKNDDFKKLMSDETNKEIQYRKQKGYRSILHEDSNNEQFLEASSLLKKYTTSALYLSTHTEREGAALEQFSILNRCGHLHGIRYGCGLLFAGSLRRNDVPCLFSSGCRLYVQRSN